MSSTPQQTINLGEAPNDGTGEPLRSAFAEVNNNFANVWAAGPVNTNVVIANSRISTDVTDQDLELAGNGTANVVVYSSLQTLSIEPQADSAYDLGAPGAYYDSSYARYYQGSSATITGTIAGSTITASNNFKLPVYANTAVRNSAITNPLPGMMIYVTGTGLQVYGATQWNTVDGTVT